MIRPHGLVPKTLTVQDDDDDNDGDDSGNTIFMTLSAFTGTRELMELNSIVFLPRIHCCLLTRIVLRNFNRVP